MRFPREESDTFPPCKINTRYFHSAEGVQGPRVPGGAAGPADGAGHCVSGVQGGGCAHPRAALVQGWQRDQGRGHVRTDCKR